MLRSKVRFGGLVIAVGLLMYLILVQQALAAALVLSFNGALKAQTAPVLVYATESLRSPQGSVITPQMREQVAASGEVAAAAGIGITSITLDRTAASPDEQVPATLWGYQDAGLGGPGTLSQGVTPGAENEAVGSVGKFSLGEKVSIVTPSGTREVTVVGLLPDSQLSAIGTLFVPWDTYEPIVREINPRIRTVVPTLLGVRPAGSEAAVVSSLRDASSALDPLPKVDAATDFPGAAEVQQSFLIILGLFGIVVPLVTGLFFLITTLQKARSLTLLRAVGSRSGVLATSVLAQILFVLTFGIGLGVGLYALTTLIEVGTLRVRFDWAAVLGWTLLVTGLSLIAGLGSVRRVLAIDPVTATRTGGLT